MPVETEHEVPTGYAALSFEASPGEMIGPPDAQRLYRYFSVLPPFPLAGAAQRGLTLALFPAVADDLDAFDNLQLNLSNLKEGECALAPGGTATWPITHVSLDGHVGLAFDIPGSFFSGLVATAAAERASCSFSPDDLHLVSFSLSSTSALVWVTEMKLAAVSLGPNRLEPPPA